MNEDTTNNLEQVTEMFSNKHQSYLIKWCYTHQIHIACQSKLTNGDNNSLVRQTVYNYAIDKSWPFITRDYYGIKGVEKYFAYLLHVSTTMMKKFPVGLVLAFVCIVSASKYISFVSYQAESVFCIVSVSKWFSLYRVS